MDFKNYILSSIIDNKVVIKLKVSSGAKNTEFFDIMSDGVIKVRVKSIREKGKANKELFSYLSKYLDIKNSQISFISGETDSFKNILIDFSKK
nr:DUF167 domain-containing protein [Candidatus Gracilibacteria bacterium]